jgi:hypothetical protein
MQAQAQAVPPAQPLHTMQWVYSSPKAWQSWSVAHGPSGQISEMGSHGQSVRAVRVQIAPPVVVRAQWQFGRGSPRSSLPQVTRGPAQASACAVSKVQAWQLWDAPTQTSPGVHSQAIVPPQPSSTVPQASAGQLVWGVQPQTLGTPGVPPPQV